MEAAAPAAALAEAAAAGELEARLSDEQQVGSLPAVASTKVCEDPIAAVAVSRFSAGRRLPRLSSLASPERRR